MDKGKGKQSKVELPTNIMRGLKHASSNWKSIRSTVMPAKSRKRLRHTDGKSEGKIPTPAKKPINLLDEQTGIEIFGPGGRKLVAMDCEMVGIGRDGKKSALGRVCIVGSRGEVLYDRFVKPVDRVVDYRTHVSGIRPRDLKSGAVSFLDCQKDIAKILENSILVGHALHNDMKVLMLSHSKEHIRDTSKFSLLMKKMLSGKRRPMSLKNLAKDQLDLTIQSGEHSPVIDARASMHIYLKHRKYWEGMIGSKDSGHLWKSKKKRKVESKK